MARRFLAGLGIVGMLAGPALADIPCVPEPVVPVTLDAVLDETLTTFVQNGVSLLFVSAFAVAGAPWLMAGLAVALLSLARRPL
jgi:hypothetical protein